MAKRAQRNEVVVCMIAQLAPVLDVMDLKIAHRAACLAFPAIPLQDAAAQSAIR